MPATDTSVWDYVVTYGGPSLFMTAVFVVVMPLVWFKFARPRFTRWPSRLAVMLAVWLIAWVVAYGDVLMIAREAKRVCETEAGLRVYERKSVEGFAGVSDFKSWINEGYKFTESRQVGGTYIRHELINSKIVMQKSDLPKSKVEYSYEIEDLKNHLSRDKRIVREINTGNPLAEFIEIRVYPGWIDSIILQRTGARFSPGYCALRPIIPNDTPPHVLVIKAALSPL